VKRILIDENLPPDLVRLARPGDGLHATALGSRPTDLELWQYAREHDLVILTRDTDFFAKLLLEGPPLQVVWVRCGNQRRAELTAMMHRLWPKIAEFLERADLVELHPGDRLEAVKFS